MRYAKWWLFICAWWLPSLTGATPHVELKARLEDNTLSGVARWSWVNPSDQPMSQAQFVLWANLGAEINPHLSSVANSVGFFNAWEPSKTTVKAVHVVEGGLPGDALEWSLIDGPAQIQTYSLKRWALAVNLPEAVAPGASVTLEIEFSTTVPHRIGDQGHFNDDTTWRFGWFPQPRHWADGQWSDAVLLTPFTHETRLTVPDHHGVILLGGESGGQSNMTGWATSSVPVRSVPVLISTQLIRQSVESAGVQIEAYTRSDAGMLSDDSRAQGQWVINQLRNMLRWMGERYGDYRLKRLVVVESPSSFVAMAADGMILLSDLCFIYDDTWLADGIYRPRCIQVLAHELAHQWWGLGVGVAFNSHNWLSEGMAQMLSLSYTEANLSGRDGFAPNFFVKWLTANAVGFGLPEEQLTQELTPAYEDGVRFDIEEPLILPFAHGRHHEADPYRLYQKGYLAIRALYAWLGVEQTEALLKAIYEEKAGGAPVDVADLQRKALALTGVDLTPWVKGLVEGTQTANVSVNDWSMSPDGKSVQVQLSRTGELVTPITVRAEGLWGHADVVWDASAPTQTVKIPVKGTVDRVIADPEMWAPDTRRYDNALPRKTRFKWLAPTTDSDAHVLSLTPLPVGPYKNHGLGLLLSGTQSNRWGWSTGAGVVAWQAYAAPGEDVEDDEVQRDFGPLSSASAGGWWRLDRGHTLLARVYGHHSRTLNGGAVYTLGTASVAHQWAVFRETELGITGVTEIPRLVLSVEGHLDTLAIHTRRYGLEEAPGLSFNEASENRMLEDGSTDNFGLGGRGIVGLTFNELINRGLVLTLSGGMGQEPGGRAQYGIGEALAVHTWVLPWAARLVTTAHGGVVGPAAFELRRPTVFALPATLGDGLFRLNRPYDALAEGGVRLTFPLLQALRIKNVLTLGTVFNTLSISTHYGAVVGSNWGADGLGDWSARGEVGASLDIGLALFDAQTFQIRVGAGLPVPPDDVEPADWGWFVQLGLTL
ncbi:MAG: M1 family aminopeptidase [Bradymonadia bacterium]